MKRIFLFLVTKLGVFTALSLTVYLLDRAFGLRWRRNAELGGVTTGRLRGMPPEHARAVLAHEISHIANGDMVTPRAHRSGANLTGVGSRIGALEALQRSQGESLPPEMHSFGINAGSARDITRLFMSHPPVAA